MDLVQFMTDVAAALAGADRHLTGLVDLHVDFPRAQVLVGALLGDMYEIDRDRLTSGGGTAAMDMMLEVIRRHENGDVLAAAASDLIVSRRYTRLFGVTPSEERRRCVVKPDEVPG